MNTIVPIITAATKQGRGKAKKSLDLIDAAHKILEEIQPASVRAVCYRLFVLGVIKLMSKNETGKVSKQLTYAREQGIIPWEWIVDETREAEIVNAWDNPEQLIRATVNQYRKDYWQEQPYRVEVWSEKGTVRGTVAPVLDKYGVTFRVMHGYGSSTAIHGIAEESMTGNKPFIALYVGDWDPSGLHMSEVDLPERIARYGGDIDIRRIALDDSDVADGTDLPPFDAETKRGDSRHAWFVENYGHQCWELDALPPPDLRGRVEAEIVALLDWDAWDHAIKIEAAERESMKSVLAVWQRISRPAGKYSPGAPT